VNGPALIADAALWILWLRGWNVSGFFAPDDYSSPLDWIRWAHGETTA
jgi:hypothetical protein